MRICDTDPKHEPVVTFYKGVLCTAKKGGGGRKRAVSPQCEVRLKMATDGLRQISQSCDGSAGSQNLYFVPGRPDVDMERRRGENTGRGQAKNFNHFESHTQHLSEDETGRLKPDL